MEASDNPGLSMFTYVDEVPSPARYQEVLRQIDDSEDRSWARKSVKLAVLSSFTFDPVVPFLRVEAARGGIETTVHLGDYNVIDQEILNTSSPLYGFDPDVLLMAIRLEEFAPGLMDGFLDLEPGSSEEVAEEVIGRLRGLVEHFRKQSSAGILLHNFALPFRPAFGVLEGMRADSQRHLIWKMNSQLAELSQQIPGLYIFDYAGLVMSEGGRGWQDDKMWHMARIPVAGENFRALARGYVRFLRPMVGLISKVLVLDLDNTLWGGVVGEEGLEGIEIGQAFPGSVFLDFQRHILNLHRRGVILAINSKNNLEDAKSVFTSHPDMLLKWEDFSAVRINWQDKASNMVELAKELDLGLDSFVFFDDSPVEREYVRQEIPEVLTIEVPATPLGYLEALDESGAFESLSYTEEDRHRGKLYREQAERRSFEHETVSLDDFYAGLKMEATIRAVDSQTLPRVAQLIGKTNQFNLTTRRHGEGTLKGFMDDSGHQLYSVRLKDKFGDNGVVGVGILRREGDATWWVDTFLLSCRVIGRTLETTFLAFLLEQARAAGGREVIGEFLRTKKNAPAADFYEKHNAERVEESEDRSVWRLTTDPPPFEDPGHIKKTVETEGRHGG